MRDIFASDPIRVRKDDKPSNLERGGSFTNRGSNREGMDVESVWLDITAAHRRAVRTLTPQSLKAADLYADEA